MNLAPRAQSFTTDHDAEVSEAAAFIAGQLENCDTQWSMGTFGALAEFVRDFGEPVAMGRAMLSAVTARGAIAIAPRPDMRLFASEAVTKTGWNHRVGLCLP